MNGRAACLSAQVGWQRWSSLRDPAKFDAWFDRIVVNVCRDRLKSSKYRRATLKGLEADVRTGKDRRTIHTANIGRRPRQVHPKGSWKELVTRAKDAAKGAPPTRPTLLQNSKAFYKAFEGFAEQLDKCRAEKFKGETSIEAATVAVDILDWLVDLHANPCK